MKKLLSLGCLLLLVGCSNGGEKAEITNCKGNMSGMEFETKLTKDGTSVSQEEIKMSYPFKELGIEAKVIEEQIKAQFTMFDGYKGLTTTTEKTEEDIIQVIKIDYKEADIKELAKAGILPVNPGDEDKPILFVGYKETIESYKELGLTCIVK